MEGVAIRVENLSKIYKLYEKPIDRLKESLHPLKKKYHKDFYALNDISFSVNKGETVGIIGKNGSGKSTLLKIITGVLTQSSGEIEINGRVSALLELGAGFNPEFTGVENIYLNGTMHGYSKEEMDKKVDKILEFADIGEFAKQPVKNYSSGMFARLAFAVAINIEPDILIVDEALSVGDIFFQNKCFRKFEELRKQNTTILFVSHDLGSVKQMCSRVLWIDSGRQMMYGEKELVCSGYFNKQFEENNEMNKTIINNTSSELGQIKDCKGTEKHYPILKVSGEIIKSDSAELISFFISDKAGNIVNQLQIGEEYSFHVIGKFSMDMDKLIFGFVFENNKGITLFGNNTYMKDKKVLESEKGDIIEAVFRIKLPKIAKGEYLISPAIAQGSQDNHVMLTWVHNAERVFIDNDGYNLSLIELDSTICAYKYDISDVKLYEKP